MIVRTSCVALALVFCAVALNPVDAELVGEDEQTFAARVSLEKPADFFPVTDPYLADANVENVMLNDEPMEGERAVEPEDPDEMMSVFWPAVSETPDLTTLTMLSRPFPRRAGPSYIDSRTSEDAMFLMTADVEPYGVSTRSYTTVGTLTFTVDPCFGFVDGVMSQLSLALMIAAFVLMGISYACKCECECECENGCRCPCQAAVRNGLALDRFAVPNDAVCDGKPIVAKNV
jgi:hypothetical protein